MNKCNLCSCPRSKWFHVCYNVDNDVMRGFISWGYVGVGLGVIAFLIWVWLM